jgi:hypothetical protein
MRFFLFFVLTSLLVLISCVPVKNQNQSSGRESSKVAEQNNLLTEYLTRKDVMGIYDLLDNGLDPNILIEGDPIICWATINEYDNLVEKLINMGADVNFKTTEGIPFFHLAIFRLKNETIFFILNKSLNLFELNDSESKDRNYENQPYEKARVKREPEFQKIHLHKLCYRHIFFTTQKLFLTRRIHYRTYS